MTLVTVSLYCILKQPFTREQILNRYNNCLDILIICQMREQTKKKNTNTLKPCWKVQVAENEYFKGLLLVNSVCLFYAVFCCNFGVFLSFSGLLQIIHSD